MEAVMDNNLITYGRPLLYLYSWHTVFVFLFLLLLSTVIRLPFYFPIVINWDESSNILLGQNILDGHLPYTDLWDLKPPLAFLFYAGAIALLGKSIISVRIAGTVCVALSAFLTYLTGKTIWNHRTGLLGSVICVAMLSFPLSGQAVMTEHVALVPMLGALSILVMKEYSPRNLFLAGILMAIATFVRLNLAYVSVLVGLSIVVCIFITPPYSIRTALLRGLAYVSGGCLVLLLIFLPYAVTGYQKLWLSSVLIAPLNYARFQLSAMDAFREHLGYIGNSLTLKTGPLLVVNSLMWFGGLSGLVFIHLQWRRKPLATKLRIALLATFLIGTFISIIAGGAAFFHYQLQLFPFMALFAAAFAHLCLSGYSPRLITFVSLLIVGVSILSVIPQYNKIISLYLAEQSLPYGPACEIAKYIKEENTSGEPIFMMTDQIVYWLINQKPLSKSTVHPSNISKEYILSAIVGPGTTTEMELTKILAKKPRFIVLASDSWHYLRKPVACALLRETLDTHYILDKQIQQRQIYRRKH
jgi:4-amino-4-deoxy-L-arabinose transferase-like glycosyltransferase